MISGKSVGSTWKVHVEERQQFTRSDEARDDRAGVGDAHVAKRLERERETAAGQYTSASIYPSSIYIYNHYRYLNQHTLPFFCAHRFEHLLCLCSALAGRGADTIPRLGQLLRELRELLPAPLEELVGVTDWNDVGLLNSLYLPSAAGGGRMHTHVHGRIGGE